MRARRHRATRVDYLSDALALLGGWTRDGVQLKRTLVCDDSQHAALTERIKVAADTLRTTLLPASVIRNPPSAAGAHALVPPPAVANNALRCSSGQMR